MSSFHISNPRKGTETQVFFASGHKVASVSTYLIPARGLKQKNKEKQNTNYASFHISNPRKGTETFCFWCNRFY